MRDALMQVRAEKPVQDVQDTLMQVRTEKPVQLDEAAIDPKVAPKSAKVIGNKEDGYRLRLFFPDGHDETLPEVGRPDMNGLKSIVDKNILKHKKGIRKSWIPVVSAAMKKKPVDEEVELDEGTAQVLAHGGKGQFKVVRNKEGVIEVKYKGKVISQGDYDRGAGSFFMNITGEKGQKSFDKPQDIADYFAKNKITEQVAEQLSKIKGNTPADKGRRAAVEDDIERAEKKGDKKEVAKLKEDEELDEGRMKELQMYIQQGKSAEWIAKKMGVDVKTIKALMAGYNEAYELGTNEYREYIEKLTPGETDEVDEGKMKDLVIKGQDLEMYAKKSGGIDKNDMMKVAAMLKKGDKSGALKYAKKLDTDPRDYILDLLGEASARADAMRAMRKGKEVDPADVDIGASPEDIKGASKNIIMQMRKAVSLRGNFPVEFGDGKKVKIPAKVAQAVQDKYNSIKKPADKEKFQAQVGKSYKDMLRVLKAGYNEEVELDEAKPEFEVKYAKSKKGPIKVTKFMTLDQAKEFLADVKKDGMNGIISKGGKPVKEETILERIDRKLKEKKKFLRHQTDGNWVERNFL